MTASGGGGAGRDGEDPNRTSRGARQRVGPFWIDEPHWFWAVEALTLVLAIALFALALGFDHP
ncbi:MAG TPA: hypothetical protein VMV23_11370 [Candidatus Nanopelagicaceae bacterium]|nr:hypothetical protein [Candidatus Nanopelagicaceae bacterium]